MPGGYPPPVFCKKSLEVVEKKHREHEKESQERKRICKMLEQRDL
jgi:hypothetical protein